MSEYYNKLWIFIDTIHIIVMIVPSILWSFIKIFIPKRRKDVSGQLALVTGGSEGIGREIAFGLAKKGCKIAIVNRNFENGQKTAEEIMQKFNVNVKAFKCDVSRSENVKKLKEEVQNSMGVVDILVNNAGIIPVHNSLLEGEDEYYQYCVDTNVTAWIWTTRAFLPDMIRQKRGHIIGISSLSADCPVQNMVTYAATKYANTGFMDALQAEMGFYGFDKFIKTSTVYMGFVRTNEEVYEYVSKYFFEKFLLYCEAEPVGKTIVDGILKNKKRIDANGFESCYGKTVNCLPKNIKKMFMINGMKKNNRDEYFKMRYEKMNL